MPFNQPTQQFKTGQKVVNPKQAIAIAMSEKMKAQDDQAPNLMKALKKKKGQS